MNVGATKVVSKMVAGVEWLFDSPSYAVLSDNCNTYVEMLRDEWGLHARLHVGHLYRDFHTMGMALAWYSCYHVTEQWELLCSRMLKGEYHERSTG